MILLGSKALYLYRDVLGFSFLLKVGAEFRGLVIILGRSWLTLGRSTLKSPVYCVTNLQ